MQFVVCVYKTPVTLDNLSQMECDYNYDDDNDDYFDKNYYDDDEDDDDDNDDELYSLTAWNLKSVPTGHQSH